ncbi:hypothetical protein ACWIGW_44100 [Nocardia brasiliensis]|uniref:hypothetical protein n=1 Tax=Streptomyces sp. NPDC056056 TaxID=3345698 RepID=UPI0035DF9EDF
MKEVQKQPFGVGSYPGAVSAWQARHRTHERTTENAISGTSNGMQSVNSESEATAHPSSLGNFDEFCKSHSDSSRCLMSYRRPIELTVSFTVLTCEKVTTDWFVEGTQAFQSGNLGIKIK